ncbi:hypothetical protein ACPESV_07235 [Streptomyces umbrinus]|uniref:Toxin Doc n=1 Tax=Streptomyces umbrinus TaxID=67370 RepID=A0ABU0T1G6_9ACTN|nr:MULTISPECIES: hypothetical protein [Streptomyces]MCX4557647.1 hypothetical protein [Streptomyces phaeochromogenes]MCZ4514170.1 hypothetical protein [Streptomyces sp. ActVer]MDQ1029657.1 hypothetical protein [Streptomyces umbrinus]
MSPVIRVDAGWILEVQTRVSPVNTPVADWGALDAMADRHLFEQPHGQLYYEEPAARAATLFHTALLLRPFADFNAVIGWACTALYMNASEQPVDPKPDDVHLLAGAIRAQEADLRDVARTIASWR